MLQLLHLCDSLFPLGGFAHSDGLEAAAASGDVCDAQSLQRWLDAVLDETFGRLDGAAAWQAWAMTDRSQWRDLVRLDADTIALRPAAAGRTATRAMGQRLLTTWRGLYPDPRLDAVNALVGRGALAPAYPIAFAGVCLCGGIARMAMLEALAYTRLAAAISAAMRLAPVGQGEAHAALSRTLTRVPTVAAAIAGRDAWPESFALELDIAAMSHRYLHARLFRS